MIKINITAPMMSAIPDSIKHKNMKGTTCIVWIILLLGILTAAPASAQDVVWQYDAIIPWDAERLTNNNTLITEYGNHTVIEVNTTTNEIIWQYGNGTAGPDLGQLNSPVNAERLSGDNTLITDRNNHRIIEVNSTGAIIWQYGTTGTSGSGYDELNNPMDTERLSGGNTLIADRFNNRVIEVNESKGIVWEYTITNPFDADRLSNGNTLIVEHTNHRVIEINDSDEVVWQYGDGTSGSGVNQLNNPMDAGRLANGNTLIADYINDRVIEVRTSDYDPTETDNGFTAESIVWEYVSNHPADAERLSSGSTLVCEAGNNSVIEVAFEIDLVPTALDIPTLYDNMSNTIQATILNNKSGNASSFNVSLSADGNPVDKVEVSGLGAGGSTVVNLYWTPSGTGDFELCVTADCDNNVNESDEDNNLLCGNVTVFSSEYPCWNDTFDDETKIAAMSHVVVHGGDVKHDQKSHGGWESDSSLESGLASFGGIPPEPAMAYNITGDGRWNLILGGSYGYYWDGAQWISDSSLVAGLEGSAPAIAYNITGDGKWNLISGEYAGVFNGFYWNGTQWISNPSLVAGLVDVGKYSAPTIAFNITGDGRWNLISGSESGTFCGWYWNGSQWISDSSLVAGLGDIGRMSSPVIAFNITGDGKWNMIAGKQYGIHGYYWNGTQWVSDSSVSFGLPGTSPTYLAMGFNIAGDSSWNLIVNVWDSSQYKYVYKGFRYRDGFIDTGGVKSVAIQPLARFKNWAVFNANDTVPAGTNIIYKILDASGSTIMTVVDGQNISGITQTSIRLYAELTTNNTSYTPSLHDWGVCWETGDVDLMPTAIETPAELYANVTTIDAVIANHGDAHSGPVEFDVTLYANEVEVDSNRIVVNDMPPGWSTNVMFLGWAPPHAVTYNLTVIVDSGDEILESNETNNSLAKEVTVLPSNVKRLTFDPSSSVSPGIATDSEGNLHFVRYDTMGDGSGLYYRKLAPDGTVLVADKMVSPGSGSRIAVDSSDNVHVVFNNATNSINVSYMKLDNLGNTLIEPKQVISGICHTSCGYSWAEWFSAHPCGIAVDGSGNVHVVACCNCGCLYHSDMQYIEYAKLDNVGNKLVNYTIEYLTTPGASGTWDCLGVPPSGIAVDSAGNAYTAYSKGLCGAYGAGTTDCFWPSCLEAYYVKIDSEGVHKQELTSELPGLPCPSLYPSVCVDSSDNKYVVWSQHNKTATFGYDCWGAPYRILHGFDFYLTKFDKLDNKVIDRKRLTFEDYPVDSGLSEGDTGDYYVYGVRRPIIATESGVIHAAWSVQDVRLYYPLVYISEPEVGEDNNVGYMAFDTSGDEITNKTLISLEGGNTWEPCIDACPDGAHLVWTDNRDGNNEIYYTKVLLPENRVFILSPPDDWTPRNVNATYTIGIIHTMPGSETFNLTLDNLDGADVAELGNFTITLDPFSIGEVTLNVTDADVGDYRVTVNATSQTNPEINSSATITTSVIVPEPDLIVTAMDAYHNDTGYAPYFNIPNEVDVTVKNAGNAPAGAFNVSLYADSEFVDKKNVPGLGTDGSTLLQFKWTPTGLDCEDGGTPITYTLQAIADCDNDTVESDEANNESTTQEITYWAGYSADEPINAVAWHGMLHGGLQYTTGDGAYTGLYSPGDSEDTVYSITLPAGASVELARLNVYYTWSMVSSTGVYPVMEVSITNTSGTYLVPINASYNDRPCDSPAIGYEYPWGNYVYDLTPYITGDGSYTVNVKNVGPAYYNFCISAPGLVILYEDETKPEYEFWILEGADLLEGGRRGGAGYLDLSECICNATFTGDIDTDKVDSATLGIVSAWGGAAWGEDWTSYYWFNDHYLGDGSMLGGYGSLYDKTVNSISMYAGVSGNAQVGVNVSDVTSYITGDNNTLSFGDDGDSMLAANAFLALERGGGTPPAPLLVYGGVNYPDGGPASDFDVVITNLNTSEVLAVETVTDSNYYQVMTCSYNVSAGDVLNFNASNGNATELNQTVTSDEMDDGCFVQNLTIGRTDICGDVNGDGDADMTDVMTLWYDIADYPYAGAYTISNAWAADVNCDGDIDMTDVMTLWYDIADYPYVGAYEVGCCE